MNVCYFGFYNPEYSRNRIFLKALRNSDDLNLIEINLFRKREIIDHRTKGVSLYWQFAKKFLKKRPRGGFDQIIIGYSDYLIAPIVKLLAPQTPIINDFFYSQYNTAVFDRQKVKRRTLRALALWVMDWVSLRLPNEIIVDTDTHGKYYSKEFNIKLSKFNTIYVATDTDVFYPRNVKKESDKFIIHFHGKYIPLQGVMRILEAANILKSHKEIKFRLVGKGQQYSKAKQFVRENRLKNVIFKDVVPYKELPEIISQSDLVLGIFGDSQKAKMVIPNKVFEGVACGKPVLTQESPAIKEVFVDQENIFLTLNHSQDIADKILQIKRNKSRSKEVGDKGQNLIINNFPLSYFSKKLHSCFF